MRHVWVTLMLAGCRGCACTNAVSAFVESPEDAVVEERLRDHLQKDPWPLSTLCGVPVTALKDMTLKITNQTVGVATVHVEGQAVQKENDAGGDASVDALKALACAGVLSATFIPVLDSSGKRTGWTLSSVDVDSVETPGVSYTKPAHHHHHH